MGNTHCRPPSTETETGAGEALGGVLRGAAWLILGSDGSWTSLASIA
jgi:hypothetical protein